MKKDKPNRKDDPFYNVQKVASATECTGLMPSLPQNEAEDTHYAQLYSTHRGKLRKK